MGEKGIGGPEGNGYSILGNPSCKVFFFWRVSCFVGKRVFFNEAHVSSCVCAYVCVMCWFLQAFNNLLDNTLDDLQESLLCSTIADVEKLQEEFEAFKAGGLQEANTNYDELSALNGEMAALGSTDNTYTTLTMEVWVGIN